MTAKILRETQLEGGIAVQIVQGNLLTETADAIVMLDDGTIQLFVKGFDDIFPGGI